MAVGRTEVSIVLLAVIGMLFYLVLLSNTPSDAQTGGNTTTDSQNLTVDDEIIIDDEVTVQEDVELQDDDIVEEQSTPQRSRKKPNVVNIPDKPLPPTGGLPVYATVASSVLAGTGLLVLGVGIWRGRQR